MRRNLAEILKSAKIDLLKEYTRLYKLFYSCQDKHGMTLVNECEESFLDMPFRGTCLSLADFNESFDFDFESKPKTFDINYLIVFCEYTYNLVASLYDAFDSPYKIFYLRQMNMVLDLIDYEFIYNDDMYVSILVPRKHEVIAVAEIVERKLSYSVLEYNHHSLEGDLEK